MKFCMMHLRSLLEITSESLALADFIEYWCKVKKQPFSMVSSPRIATALGPLTS